MRVVLDTNILVSALISRNGPPYRIVLAWADGLFDVVTNQIQIDEVRRVSRYPKLQGPFAPYQAGELVNRMRQVICADRPLQRHKCDDPEDAYLLDLADACFADFLVTGDHRAGLLKRKRIGNASILTATEFLARIRHQPVTSHH